MGLKYVPVHWNKQKKRYDFAIAGFYALYLVMFAGLSTVFNPEITFETLLIRSFGSLAVIILHVILSIGPLARLNPRFLPLLYNRRHLGVSMFLIALVHGGFSIMQFHTLGDTNPIVSVFTSNMDYSSLVNFPFQVLGFLALLILFLLASTSHDYWLKNLGPKTWKTLHMSVYVAYALIILHVFLGAFQQETAPLLLVFLGLGLITVSTLHIMASLKSTKEDRPVKPEAEGYVFVAEVADISNNCAKMISAGGEKIAVFKYDGKLSAVSNVCKHQNGPLGEGKVIDGCITCPWHGYQYKPRNGRSPAPFKEKVSTYRLKMEGTKVYVNPEGLPPGTEVEPITIQP